MVILVQLNYIWGYFNNDLSLFCGLASMLRTGELNNSLRLGPQALSSYPVCNTDISPQNSDKLLHYHYLQLCFMWQKTALISSLL